MATATSTKFDEKLENACRLNSSRLCVGLDHDLEFISPDKVAEFNEILIRGNRRLCLRVQAESGHL